MKSETYRPGQYRGSQLALLVVADCVVSGPLLVEIIMGLLGGTASTTSKRRHYSTASAATGCDTQTKRS